jgi:hypothetical protein
MEIEWKNAGNARWDMDINADVARNCWQSGTEDWQWLHQELQAKKAFLWGQSPNVYAALAVRDPEGTPPRAFKARLMKPCSMVRCFPGLKIETWAPCIFEKFET